MSSLSSTWHDVGRELFSHAATYNDPFDPYVTLLICMYEKSYKDFKEYAGLFLSSFKSHFAIVYLWLRRLFFCQTFTRET